MGPNPRDDPHMAAGGRATGRWRTPEFVAYSLVLAGTAAHIIHRAVALSSMFGRGGESSAAGSRMLRPGWILGRRMDLSDSQWSTFRGSLGLAAAVFGGFACLSAGAQRAFGRRARVPFYLVFAAAYLGYLHGATSMFLLAACVASYASARAAAGRPYLGPAVVWGVNCLLLHMVRDHGGFYFSQLSPSLRWLDMHRGSLRWHVSYNMVVLRAISFGMDLHWARLGEGPQEAKGKPAPAPLPYADRVRAAQPPPCYSLPRFLAYALYPPLYVAGPTTTFNAFSSHLDSPQASYTPRQVAAYGARWVACLLGLEVLTHYMYVNALAKTGAWRAVSGWGEAERVWLVGYFVLNFMWLKFLVIWRFFRLVALMDGIECPENMRRCVNNTTDIAGFWQSWHASYNRWLVRYMYVPMGGARWKVANVWVIFTFVGVWHDMGDHLLGWAWLMAGAALPEVAFKWAGARWVERGGPKVRGTWQYRQARALGATVMILVLISANLVGFVIGLRGLRDFLRAVFSLEEAGFGCVMLAYFFTLSHVVFEYREGQERREAARRFLSQSNGGGAGGGSLLGGGLAAAPAARVEHSD